MTLFDTGIRPAIDAYLAAKSKEMRDYGDYWSASSAGYCMRKQMFERLGVPPVVKESDARKQRVFSAGDVFHQWVQRITKDAGLSIAQELELQDEEIMARGHIDDLVLIKELTVEAKRGNYYKGRLILYDYKSTHSDSFHRGKNRYPLSHYHKMQTGTYMYMLRKKKTLTEYDLSKLSEARILKISKDDLCMDEYQNLWTPQLEKEVVSYWKTLNGYWAAKKLPKCTCADFEGGFMSWEKFNPFFYEGEPCSLEYYKRWAATKVREKI